MAKLTGKKEIEFLQGQMNELSDAMAKVSAQVKKGTIRFYEDHNAERRMIEEQEEGEANTRIWRTIGRERVGRCRFSVRRVWTPPERRWEEPEDLLTVFVTIQGRGSAPPSSAYVEILNGEVQEYCFTRTAWVNTDYDTYLFIFDPKGRITKMNTSSGNEDLKKLKFKPIPARAIPKLKKPASE